PDRKKMSKSKGNVVTPGDLVARHGADGVRYWAASAGPGTDTAADEGQMKIGRRLANKILNASRFVLGLGSEISAGAGPEDGRPGGPAAGRLRPEAVTVPVDRAMLSQLAAVVEAATADFDGYQYHQALERIEKFFWDFCADYLELVKVRGYSDGPGAESARAALAIGLEVQLRLFAPFLPFVTEEVWSWWRPGSVHRAPWPDAADLAAATAGADPEVLTVAASVLAEVRKAKSTRKLSLRTEVLRLTVLDAPGGLAALRVAEDDLRAAGVVTDLVLGESDERSVTVELAPAG
ncbi:MAG: class I tRNA ligase family protein, partial [Actinomycetota bacterium]|nr:class I tRNA ligase family protein [Actinomycetota bacterium]